MKYRILIFIMISSFCRAQTPGKTLVFTVRAPATVCSIYCLQPFFWLETNNPVHIKVKAARNKKITVDVIGGKVMSVEDETYYIRFTQTGTGVINVYQNTPYGRELIATKKQEIKNPDLYLCGIKTDSVSKSIRLRGENMYAYSNYYKKNMSIVSFDMFYIEDTTKKHSEPLRLKADSCILTPAMRKIIFKFQPKFSSIYFHNIICQVPDGSKRILDPVRLDILIDTTDHEHISLIYSVKKKKL